MALLALCGIASSNNQTNMYALAASGNRRNKQADRLAKKKLPERKPQRDKKSSLVIIAPQKAKTDQHKSKPKNQSIPKKIKKHIKKRHQKRKQNMLSTEEKEAKSWVAWHESRGRWNVSNGSCYGKYQLSYGYLHGDYSHANQSQAADHYVHNRYGTWQNAKRFWQYHHWY